MALNKKAFYITTAVLAACGLFYGGYIVITEQIRLLKSYCYRIKNVKVRTANKDLIEFQMDLMFKNQSDVDVDIKGYKFDILIDSIHVGFVESKTAQIIKAKTVSLFSITVKVLPKEVFRDLVQIIGLLAKFATNPNSIVVTIKGNITAKHSIIMVKDLPIEMSMTIAESLSDDASLEKCTI
jgi:LEA14-like dessication related protein